jgi:hypothetical protein
MVCGITCFLPLSLSLSLSPLSAALIKEKGTILKNRNAINTQLQAIEKEISVFQRKKQGSLNDVDIYLTLRLNQVQWLLLLLLLYSFSPSIAPS